MEIDKEENNNKNCYKARIPAGPNRCNQVVNPQHTWALSVWFEVDHSTLILWLDWEGKNKLRLSLQEHWCYHRDRIARTCRTVIPGTTCETRWCSESPSKCICSKRFDISDIRTEHLDIQALNINTGLVKCSSFLHSNHLHSEIRGWISSFLRVKD